jgi:hypothetical protein
VSSVSLLQLFCSSSPGNGFLSDIYAQITLSMPWEHSFMACGRKLSLSFPHFFNAHFSLQSDKNDGGYHRVKRWFKVDKLLSTQHILIPININKKCVILKSHSCFPISCLITVIGSLPSSLFLRSVYSLRIIPCKSSNLQMLYHHFYTLQSGHHP